MGSGNHMLLVGRSEAPDSRVAVVVMRSGRSDTHGTDVVHRSRVVALHGLYCLRVVLNGSSMTALTASHHLLLEVIFVLLVLLGRNRDGLELASKHHTQCIWSLARLNLGDAGSLSPIIKFSSELFDLSEKICRHFAGHMSVSL